MKVRVTVTLDIDYLAWSNTYGIEGAGNIRRDVKAWAENALYSHADELGLLRHPGSPSL